MAETFDFPHALRRAQIDLHEARADLAALASALPWSAEPMSAWSTHEGNWYESSRPDSPGWTEDQQHQMAALRDRVLELSVIVTTHPFWGAVEAGRVVEARTALKYVSSDGAAVDGAAA